MNEWVKDWRSHGSDWVLMKEWISKWMSVQCTVHVRTLCMSECSIQNDLMNELRNEQMNEAMSDWVTFMKKITSRFRTPLLRLRNTKLARFHSSVWVERKLLTEILYFVSSLTSGRRYKQKDQLLLNMKGTLRAYTQYYTKYRSCTATKIPFMYSFSGNSQFPISTFMFLWAIYKFPGSVHIFPAVE